MTLTTHGHHIPYSPTDDEDPNTPRARCGGTVACRRCSRESGAIWMDVPMGKDGLVETSLPANIQAEMLPLGLIEKERDATQKVLDELYIVRKEQLVVYDEAHDDAHGPGHLYRELNRRVGNLRSAYGPRRAAVLKMAAICVALVEYWDRNEK